MISSGIRVGAWDYLYWGNIQPIEQEGKIVAARMIPSLDQIHALSYNWNKEHCDPPLYDVEFEHQWKTAMKFIGNHIKAEKVLEALLPSTNKMAVKRTVEVELIIDPMQMKAVHGRLGNKIVEYERIFGNIPSPEEVESKKRHFRQ